MNNFYFVSFQFVNNVLFIISIEFSKQGIMTECLISLIRYANKDLGISRIEAATLSNNIASRRLLEKCNFKYEGVGQYFLQIKGKWEHHILYANICDSRKIRLKN